MMLQLNPAPSDKGNWILRDTNTRTQILIEHKDLIPVAQSLLRAAESPPPNDLRYGRSR